MIRGSALCFGTLISIVLFPAVLARGSTVTQGPTPPRFKAVALEPLAGGNQTTANDINDHGQVAGASTTGGTGYPNAVTWIDGRVIDISGAGVSGAAATAINNAGVVVGWSDEIGLNAFSWHNGVLTPLEFPHACCSQAQAVNGQGIAVGNASLAGANTPNDGVLWNGEKLVPLGTLGGTLAHAYGINDAGQVVGISDVQNNGEYFPFIWQDGVMNELPSLGGTWNTAFAISNVGVGVGFCSPATGGGMRAVKWLNGRVIELPMLGGPISQAMDINENGWIVGNGWASAQASTTAILWIDDQPLNLNLLTMFEPGSQLYDARGVNEVGQIVGEGLFDDHFRGYVLTPLRPGDVNGDDAVNIADLLGVIGTWGACPLPHAVATCPGDVTVNGTVNIADLLRVIGDWG